MNINENINRVIKATAENTERVILMGLQDLVKKGLLVVEKGSPQLYCKTGRDQQEFEVGQEIKLVLKDQKYIEELEIENQKLREIISDLNIMERGE